MPAIISTLGDFTTGDTGLAVLNYKPDGTVRYDYAPALARVAKPSRPVMPILTSIDVRPISQTDKPASFAPVNEPATQADYRRKLGDGGASGTTLVISALAVVAVGYFVWRNMRLS